MNQAVMAALNAGLFLPRLRNSGSGSGSGSESVVLLLRVALRLHGLASIQPDGKEIKPRELTEIAHDLLDIDEGKRVAF